MRTVEAERVLTSDSVTDESQRSTRRPMITGVRTGTLIGFSVGGGTPLVTYNGQSGSAALPARAVVDLSGSHIGREVVLMFDDCDPCRPIVMGWLRGEDAPGSVEVDGDGERLIVRAKEQLVLRCGKASITLTKAGKVLIRGTHVSTHSSGVNRLRGASIQLN